MEWDYDRSRWAYYGTSFDASLTMLMIHFMEKYPEYNLDALAEQAWLVVEAIEKSSHKLAPKYRNQND